MLMLNVGEQRETVTYMDFGCRGEAVTDWLLGQTDKNTHTHTHTYSQHWIMNDPGNTL